MTRFKEKKSTQGIIIIKEKAGVETEWNLK